MSREPFRPTARGNGTSQSPAEELERAFLGRTEPARDWDRAPQQLPAEPDLPPMPKTAPEVSLSEIVDSYGDAASLARELGVSQRQVKRYLSGRADPAKARRGTRERLDAARDRLAQQRLAEQRRETRRARKELRDAQREQRRERGQSEWGAVIDRLGGVEATAAQLGRHRRTVERWLSGQRHPNVVDQERLARADRHVRVREAFNISDRQDGGAAGPTAPSAPSEPEPGAGPPRVYVRASGYVHVEDYYRYQRQIGVQGELAPGGRHPLPPQVTATMLDCMGRGDREGALRAFEEHLSTEYAQCDAYDPNGTAGWHFQDIQEFELIQLPDDATLDSAEGVV